jgi:hypothetical protein
VVLTLSNILRLYKFESYAEMKAIQNILCIALIQTFSSEKLGYSLLAFIYSLAIAYQLGINEVDGASCNESRMNDVKIFIFRVSLFFVVLLV